ncbi:MAG: ornithine carbamoyltransferase [Candidatus Micrarchaeaceae archaeon]
MPSFLSVADVDKKAFKRLIDRAAFYKKAFGSNAVPQPLKNKFVALLFEKPSTRTRASFEVAAEKMGAKTAYLQASELQLGRGEPVKDAARMFSEWFNAIVARVYKHSTLKELATYSQLPVINALSNTEHPTQVISDFLTIMEFKKRLEGLKIAFIGDANNVSASLALGSGLLGIDFSLASPKGYSFAEDTLVHIRDSFRNSGSSLLFTNFPKEAAKDADVLYTDVWVSMGEEKETVKRMHDFKSFQINNALMRFAKKDAIVMHCLPAHRGLEITEEVLEGEHSVVWQQGRNKIYGAASALEFALQSRGKAIS